MEEWDYGIEFQYLAPGHNRPSDQPQDQKLNFKHSQFFPIPDIGDTVTYQECGKTVDRKVLTKHFALVNGKCIIYIVVGELSEEEFSKRCKS